MATLHFSANHEVRGTGVGALSGALTLAALVQRDGTSTYQGVISTYLSGGGFQVEYGFYAGSNVLFYDTASDAAAQGSTAIAPTSSDCGSSR